MITWNESKSTPPPKDGTIIIGWWGRDENDRMCGSSAEVVSFYSSHNEWQTVCCSGSYHDIACDNDPDFWSQINNPNKM